MAERSRLPDGGSEDPLSPEIRGPTPSPTAWISPETAARWHGVNDLATEILLYAVAFFAAWGFGATQSWMIDLLNRIGYLLGLLLLFRWILGRAEGHPPSRWGDPAPGHEMDRESRAARKRRLAVRVMVALTLCILGYAWVAVVNARSSGGAAGVAGFRTDWKPWLPHSYDAAATGWALQGYLALALTFWAAWDWFRGKTRAEQESYFERLPERMNPALPFIPGRASRWLWFLCASGAALGLASILQRLSGGTELLWLMPSSVGDAGFHFGPFNYRANGAQYFNLLWPVCLAFWWLTRALHQAATQLNERAGTGAHALLFPFGVLMGACPLISTNRVGALLSIAAAPLVYGLLAWDARNRNSKHRWSLHALFACLVALALYLGWTPLERRFDRVSKGLRVDPGWSERQEQYRTTGRLIRDHWLFGTGPQAYHAVHGYYLEPHQTAYRYAHNDWLQTVAEWGAAGAVLVFLLLGLAIGTPWWAGLGEPALVGAAGVGLMLVLVHSMVDFPLQVHGILLTFSMLCALLLALPPRREHP